MAYYRIIYKNGLIFKPRWKRGKKVFSWAVWLQSKWLIASNGYRSKSLVLEHTADIDDEIDLWVAAGLPEEYSTSKQVHVTDGMQIFKVPGWKWGSTDGHVWQAYFYDGNKYYARTQTHINFESLSEALVKAQDLIDDKLTAMGYLAASEDDDLTYDELTG